MSDDPAGGGGDEGERTITSPAKDSDVTADSGEGPSAGEESRAVDAPTGERSAIDRNAEGFLDLEGEFPSETDDREPVYGTAIGIDRVDASAVPADYPRRIETDTVVALTVEIPVAEEATTCYFAWPEPGVETRFTRLLDVLDVPRDRLADLHGRQFLLRVEDGYFVPAVPPEGLRGDARGRFGVYLGVAANALALALGLAGLGGLLGSAALVLLLLVNLVVLPIGTYLDAWHLRTRTDWDQSPGLWTILAALVGFNLVTSLLYLYTKRGSRPIRG